jgi:hypothetical protein
MMGQELGGILGADQPLGGRRGHDLLALVRITAGRKRPVRRRPLPPRRSQQAGVFFLERHPGGDGIAGVQERQRGGPGEAHFLAPDQALVLVLQGRNLRPGGEDFNHRYPWTLPRFQ